MMPACGARPRAGDPGQAARRQDSGDADVLALDSTRNSPDGTALARVERLVALSVRVLAALPSADAETHEAREPA
jgi:hypothetical protein